MAKKIIKMQENMNGVVDGEEDLAVFTNSPKYIYNGILKPQVVRMNQGLTNNQLL